MAIAALVLFLSTRAFINPFIRSVIFNVDDELFSSFCVEIGAEDAIGRIYELVVGGGEDANTEVIVGLAIIVIHNIIIANDGVRFSCQSHLNIF
jgi:hypothetical protein